MIEAKELQQLSEVELRELVFVQERLLDERTRLLQAIPACPVHGHECLPHAIDWVKERRNESEFQKPDGPRFYRIEDVPEKDAVYAYLEIPSPFIEKFFGDTGPYAAGLEQPSSPVLLKVNRLNSVTGAQSVTSNARLADSKPWPCDNHQPPFMNDATRDTCEVCTRKRDD